MNIPQFIFLCERFGDLKIIFSKVFLRKKSFHVTPKLLVFYTVLFQLSGQIVRH